MSNQLPNISVKAVQDYTHKLSGIWHDNLQCESDKLHGPSAPDT